MALLDQLMANAWPPVVVEHHQGWRLRWADGVTRRANSALAVGGDEKLDEMVDAVEAFYGTFGAPPMIQVSSASAPPSLGPLLTTRGYRSTARTFVLRAAALDVAGHDGLNDAVLRTERPSDGWFETYWSVESQRGRDPGDAELCRGVLLAPSQASVFVEVHDGPEVISVGQIVLESGWAGVQCMATKPAHRRRGAASVVLRALATEAASRHAEHMYLAVMADNTAGVSLYEGVGFRPTHEYCYWSLPEHRSQTTQHRSR